MGQIRGPNLFHSFGQFNLFQGESATFTGPNTVTNILSRVTGGSPSSIDGTIRSQIPGANLYLLNPSGVMFGPNASLDVGGSFHVSTADYLRLADGATFAAHPAVPTVLSVAPPAAFGFLRSTPAVVSSQGSTLHVPPGQTLAVTGGDIAIVGGVPQAPSGQINLVSVASPGEVLVSPRELALESQADSGAGRGRLELSGGALVTVSSSGSQNAGEIAVRAGTLTLSGEGSFITSRTDGDGGGGSVTVWAHAATLTGGAQMSSSSGRFSSTLGRYLVGQGDGGDVTLSATEALTIAGQNATGTVQSGVVSQTFGMGHAGRVTITTPRLTMAEGGRIGTDTGGDGRAGDVVVQVGSAALMSGAQISSRSGIEDRGTFRVGTGSGGTVILSATEGVTLAGQGSSLAASTAGQGQGGEITVRAPRVELTEGAVISAASTGHGDAGNVILTLGDTFVSTNSSVVTQATQADGGNIQITTPTMVRLRHSAITAEVGGGATTVGGNINIDPQFVLLQNSQIVANAFEGQGGNIRIQAQRVFLADPASQVSASSALGINGVVNIQAPVTNISGTVAPLPQGFASSAELLRDRCAGRLWEGRLSRLVIGGRDGVPSEPGSLLPSPPVQTGSRANGEWAGTSARMGPAQGNARHVQTGALEELEAECAKWTGQKGTTVGKKR